jgi:hypothetical protein
MKRLQLLVIGLFFALPASGFAADPTTLVVKGADGKIAPGLATSWKADGATVVFELAKGADGKAIAALLEERLANVEVAVDGNRLTISGIPAPALLEQLASLALSGDGDPLADLAGMGTVVAMSGPEAGGSIRAGKPMAIPSPRSIGKHDPKERIQAEVIEVKPGQFPNVTLKLRLRSTVRHGALKGKLRAGRVVEAPVILTSADGAVDFNKSENQRNLVGFYLSRGDRVTVHLVSADEKALEIDFIERRRR